VKERYTIDASVWVAAPLPTDLHHQSSRDVLVRLMAQNAPIICPTLILPEVAAAVARNTDNDELAIQGSEAVRDFPGMTLRLLEPDLAMKAARLAATHRLRGADALYVTVAAEEQAVLVIWDAEIHNRGAAAVHTVTPDKLLLLL
jgi:predicted nucleic acid-binding protein